MGKVWLFQSANIFSRDSFYGNHFAIDETSSLSKLTKKLICLPNILLASKDVTIFDCLSYLNLLVEFGNTIQNQSLIPWLLEIIKSLSSTLISLIRLTKMVLSDPSKESFKESLATGWFLGAHPVWTALVRLFTCSGVLGSSIVFLSALLTSVERPGGR